MPLSTGSGEAVLIMATSACEGEATTVLAVAELLPGIGSLVAEPAVAVMEIVVPGVSDCSAFTTRGKLLTVPEASVVAAQLILPEEPTAGVIQAQPRGTVREIKLAVAGMVSLKVSVAAAPGPLFVTL